MGVGAGFSVVNHQCPRASAAEVRFDGSSASSPFNSSNPCVLIDACPLRYRQPARHHVCRDADTIAGTWSPGLSCKDVKPKEEASQSRGTRRKGASDEGTGQKTGRNMGGSGEGEMIGLGFRRNGGHKGASQAWKKQRKARERRKTRTGRNHQYLTFRASCVLAQHFTLFATLSLHEYERKNTKKRNKGHEKTRKTRTKVCSPPFRAKFKDMM